MRSPLKHIIIIVVAAVVSIAGIDRMPQLITIACLSAAGVYFILRTVTAADMRAKLVCFFVIAFLLFVLLSISLYNQTVGTKYYGFSYRGDDYVYGDFGAIVGNMWRSGFFPSLKKLEHFSLIGEYSQVQIYQLYSAAICYLFGTCGGQILLIINCFFHAAIIIPVYFICKSLNIKEEVSTVIICLFLFWPSTAFWAAFNFKEPIILLALFSVFSLILRLQEKFTFSNLLFLIFSYSVLFLVKRHFSVLLPFIILQFFVLWSWKYKGIASLGLAALFILRQIANKPILSNLYVTLSTLPKRFSDARHSCFFTNTSYFCDIPTDTYLGTILFFPFGFGAALLLPFLLRPFELNHVAANIESIAWWALIPFLVNGIWIAIKKEAKKTFVMLIAFFYWISALAITQASMGTLIKQKAVIYYIGFIFIGLAMDRTVRAVEKRRPAL